MSVGLWVEGGALRNCQVSRDGNGTVALNRDRNGPPKRSCQNRDAEQRQRGEYAEEIKRAVHEDVTGSDTHWGTVTRSTEG